MITIDNLTLHQINLLEIMWAIKDTEKYDIWKSNLSLEVMNEVETLEHLVLFASLDEVQDLSAAKEVLSKFALKG